MAAVTMVELGGSKLDRVRTRPWATGAYRPHVGMGDGDRQDDDD